MVSQDPIEEAARADGGGGAAPALLGQVSDAFIFNATPYHHHAIASREVAFLHVAGAL